MENDFGIGGMHPIHQFFGILQESGIAQFGLLAPSLDGPADELGAEVVDHADVIVPIRKLVALRVAGNQEKAHGD